VDPSCPEPPLVIEYTCTTRGFTDSRQDTGAGDGRWWRHALTAIRWELQPDKAFLSKVSARLAPGIRALSIAAPRRRPQPGSAGPAIPGNDTAVSNGVCTMRDLAPSSNDQHLAFVHSSPPTRDGAVSARLAEGSPVIGRGRANTAVAG
jgi:hypothetical protein